MNRRTTFLQTTPCVTGRHALDVYAVISTGTGCPVAGYIAQKCGCVDGKHGKPGRWVGASGAPQIPRLPIVNTQREAITHVIRGY